MTDLKKFKSLLKEMGITDFEILTSEEIGQYEEPIKYAGVGEESVGSGDELKWDTVIKINSGVGYADSFCNFYFLKGKCQRHGCWE